MSVENVSPEARLSDHWSRRVERLEARRARREARYSGGWVGGFALVVLGTVFLVQNVTGFELNNWWALFILIPAAASFATAWTRYSSSGRLTTSVSGSFVGGLMLSFVAAVFLLNLSWTVMWPVFLIVAGISALLGALLPRPNDESA